jgi:hypothetical protein
MAPQIELIWVSRVAQWLLDNESNSGQRQRWSFMTALYLSVRNWWYNHIWRGSLKYTRCAILECHYPCMFSTPKSRKWANKSFVISVPLLRLSPLMHCGYFFWLVDRHAVIDVPVSFTNAVSTKCSINACHSHSTTILRRSEWNCWRARWFDMTSATGVSSLLFSLM